MVDAQQGDDALRLERQLCFAVYSAAHAYGRFYKPLLEPLGLTYPQYLVMLVLWQDDGLTVKAIGQRLMLDSGTLTPLLKRLEAAGLLRRTRDVTDERQVRIGLTAAGQALREPAKAVPAAVAQAFGGSEQQAVSLMQSLVSLRQRLLEVS